MDALRWSVIGAAGYSAVSLAGLVLRSRRSKRPAAVAAAPFGSARRGIAYALGKGLLPWAKESTRLHPVSYLAGIGYHVGILAGFITTALFTLDLRPSAFLWNAVRAAIGLGLVCGIGLLAKRMAKHAARGLSHPDDYASNALVDLFLATALAATWLPAAVPIFFSVAIVLALYIPLGKLRHGVFFFCSRILFGSTFGLRGVLPPARHELRP